MVKLAQNSIRSTELSIAYSPCYKLDAFDGFQFIAKVFRQLAYNKAGYEGFIRKRHEKDSWSKGRNIEYGGEAEADFMPEAEYQEQL